MKKKIVALGMSAMMTLAMAVPAMAANLTGPFFYMSAVQSEATAAPSHAQNCVAKVVDEGDKVAIYTKAISTPVAGEITSITFNGEELESKEVTEDGVTYRVFYINKAEAYATATEDGLIQVSVTISMAGHPVNLNNIYLDIAE